MSLPSCYLLSDVFYLKLAITCKNMLPFACYCTSRIFLIMTPPLRNQHDQNSASNCIVHQISLCKNSLYFYFYNKICNETISFLVVGKLMETIYILRKRNKKKLPSSTPTSTTTSTDFRISFISLFPEPPLHPPGIVVKLHIQHHI